VTLFTPAVPVSRGAARLRAAVAGLRGSGFSTAAAGCRLSGRRGLGSRNGRPRRPWPWSTLAEQVGDTLPGPSAHAPSRPRSGRGRAAARYGTRLTSSRTFAGVPALELDDRLPVGLRGRVRPVGAHRAPEPGQSPAVEQLPRGRGSRRHRAAGSMLLRITLYGTPCSATNFAVRMVGRTAIGSCMNGITSEVGDGQHRGEDLPALQRARAVDETPCRRPAARGRRVSIPGSIS